MGRNYLAHRNGDLNNAILAAAGYNFRRLIKWLRILLRLILIALFPKSKLSSFIWANAGHHADGHARHGTRTAPAIDVLAPKLGPSFQCAGRRRRARRLNALNCSALVWQNPNRRGLIR